MKELKSAERRFERAQEQWNHYRSVDAPAFERWRHLAFGPLEQELAACHAEMAPFAEFLDDLQNEEFIQARPLTNLLAELLEHAALHDDGQPANRLDGTWSPAYLSSCAYTLWEEPRLREIESRREEARKRRHEAGQRKGKKRGLSFEDLFDEILGLDDEDDMPDDEPFWSDRPGPGSPQRHRAANPRREQDIRSLYRKLCRQLHPDVAGESTAYTRRLWHEVQNAYEARDLERLEALFAAWELKGDPTGKNSTFSRILAATKECLAGLRAVQRDIRKARKHISWQFAATGEPERNRRAAPIMRELRLQRDEFRRESMHLKNHYLSILRSARRPGARRKNSANYS